MEINYQKQFGIDPKSIGARYREHGIVESIDSEEACAGAEIGDLIVRTRDNGIDYIDTDALALPNYRGTSTDSFDCTYRYYYFSPLPAVSNVALRDVEGQEAPVITWTDENGVTQVRHGRKVAG